MAQHAENENTIGVASQRWLTDTDQQSEFVMTKLSRQPGWMGFNPLLRNLQQVAFMVYHSEQSPALPGYPAQDTDLSRYEHNRFPTGPAQDLREALPWHGAATCAWTNVHDDR